LPFGSKSVLSEKRLPFHCSLAVVLFLLFLPVAHMRAQEAPQAPVQVQCAREAAAEPAAAVRRARGFAASRQVVAQPDGIGVDALAASSLAVGVASSAASEGAEIPASAAEAMAIARGQHFALATAQDVSLSTAWVPVGPVQVQSQSYGLVTGRVTSLALDPNDPTNNTLYVGTSGGGVWKSTTAASGMVGFTPLTDTLAAFSPNAGGSAIPSLSIGALSVQPGGTGVILAGTGDPNDASDSYYGAGILRSADNGQSWSLTPTAGSYSFVGEGIAGFAWSTTSPQLVVVAVSSSAEGTVVGAETNLPSVRGLYYSTDGGKTWTLSTVQDGSTIIQNRTTNYSVFRGNAATSVVWNPVRKKFYAAIRAHGYYESSDGVTWTRMANQPGSGLTTVNCPSRPGDYGLLACPIYRGALAVQPVSGDMFAITVDQNNVDQGLWQDACAISGSACTSATVVWATRISTANADVNGTIPQGDYNLTLAAVPAATSLSTADTLLFLGAGDLYRCSLAGGCSLRNTTNATTGCAAPAAVAPAQHAIAWGLNAGNTAEPTMYFGNDGGLWRSLDGVRQQAGVCSADDTTHFDNLNGALGSLAEVSSLASDPNDANVMLAALGANGSAAATSSAQITAQSPWVQLSAAESGVVAIDQGNGSNWMLQSGGGVALHTCTNGKQCTATDFSGPAAIGPAQVSGDASRVDPPVLLDPALSTNAIVGTCRVWRGPTGGQGLWSGSNAISSVMGNGTCSTAGPLVRSLAAGGTLQVNAATQNSGSSVLYAGMSGTQDGGGNVAGHIFATFAAGTAGAATSWKDLTSGAVTNGLSTRFNAAGYNVSSIAVDTTDPTGMTVYAAVQGFGYPHIFRSTNGGTSWLNISSNLPNAPANAVLIDPNNPATVYVAMDTGVYVAQDVTTCVNVVTNATGSCWSVYGTALPNAPVTGLSASPNFGVSGGSSMGVLRAATYGRGIWEIPLVTAGQVAAPAVTFSPSSLTFGPQAANTTSAAQQVTLTNSGTDALQINGVTVSSGFVEVDNCVGVSLKVGATCTLNVSFAPTTAGPVSGSVQVLANVSGGYASLALTGTSTGAPSLALTPASLAFGSVALKSTSAAQTVTVTNSGSSAATLSAPTVTADFTVSTSCGATLAVGASCSISVAYAPTALGPNNGVLTLKDDVGAHTVALTGTGFGTPNVTYSPTSFVLHDAILGSAGGTGTVTITNTGTAGANISQPVFAGDFRLYQDTCPPNLSAGFSCSITTVFVPTGTGTRTGSMTITDDAGPHVISLSGNSLASSTLAMPLQLNFPQTAVNTLSPTQTLTLQNTGGSIDVLGVFQVNGDFAIRGTTCGSQINAYQSCTLTVVFAPSAAGNRVGSITVPFNNLVSLSQSTTLLYGTGAGTPLVSITPSSLDFGNVGIGSASDPQLVQISNPGTGALTLTSQQLAGSSDFRIASTTCGNSVPAGGSCTLSMVLAPTSAGAKTGTLTLVDALGTHTITLTGTGAGQASLVLSPASVSFDTVAIGQSASQVVTLTNAGSASIGVVGHAATGDFHIASSTCPARLDAGASCLLTVDFTPTVDGPESGTLTVTDTASVHTIPLAGTGLGNAAISFTPAALVFGNTTVNSASAPLTATLRNTGNAAIALNPPTVSGDFQIASTDCDTTLAAGASCSVNVIFAPLGAGVRSGILSLADANNTHAVALQGTSVSGVLSVSPSVIQFYDATLNTTTATRSVVLANTGNAALTLGTVTVSDEFHVSANCNGVQLAGGSTCTLTTTFSPTTAGTHNGEVSIPSSNGGTANAVATVTLTGNGKSPFNLTLLPLSVDFGTQLVGASSSVINVTLNNTGTIAGALQAITVNGSDFSLTANTCSTSLPPQTGCTVSLVFTPTVSGARSGVLTVVSDAGRMTVPLTGVGNVEATDTLSPLSLSFGQQVVGTVSGEQLVSLTNSGDVPLTLVAAQVVQGDFTAVNRCGPTLQAHASCAIAVSFAPKNVGPQRGVLQITDVQHAQSVMLSGTGLAGAGVSLAPQQLVFANTGVGAAGAGQTLTLTNNGGVPLQLSGVTVTGDFGILSGTSNCTANAVIPMGGSCSMSIAFVPTATGLRTGMVSIAGNAATQTAQLSGMGVDFALVANGPTSQSIGNGSNAVFPLLLRPSQYTNDPVSFACSGAPAFAKCTVTSQYSDLSAISTVSLTVLTGTAATSSQSVRFFVLLPLLGLLPLCSRRRRVRGALLMVALFALLAATQGCGADKVSALAGTGSGDNSGGGNGGVTTPKGTYTITASATAAGATRSVQVTLVVQ